MYCIESSLVTAGESVERYHTFLLFCFWLLCLANTELRPAEAAESARGETHEHGSEDALLSRIAVEEFTNKPLSLCKTCVRLAEAL